MTYLTEVQELFELIEREIPKANGIDNVKFLQSRLNRARVLRLVNYGLSPTAQSNTQLWQDKLDELDNIIRALEKRNPCC